MLINILKHNLKVTGIIHCGAHWGQEYNTYIKMGVTKVCFIEPAKDAFSKLLLKFYNNSNITLINAAAGEKIGKALLNIERNNQGQSNSLLQMGTHLKQHPGINFTSTEEVPVIPLDFIDSSGYNMLIMDCQGFEGQILKGATNTLAKMDYVYTEVNREEVYKGCAMVNDIDKLLPDFVRVETKWIGGWGDALYKKK